MAPLLRMSKDQRRAAILHSVKRVFAEKGFDRTTTRELADAAGVSEALLFKHFPTKEALFNAMLSACCSEQDRSRFAALKSLDNSASTLVLMVHFLATLVIGKSSARDPETMVQNRLFLRSLCERGEF